MPMKKKIAITILIVLLTVTAILLFITLHKDNGVSQPADPVPVSKDVPVAKNEPIQFEDPEEDSRPEYTASDYVKCNDYQTMKDEIQTDYKTEAISETEEQVSDAEITEELLLRAEEAGVNTNKTLNDQDAAEISGQKYQTIDEYRAYLKDVLTQKKEFSKKTDMFYSFIERIAENSEQSGIPPELEEYEGKYAEDQLENRAKMLGFSIDSIKESGEYDSFKQTASEQSSEDLLTELYIKYIAEKEGVVVEDEDINEMLEFYTDIYGQTRTDIIQNTYTPYKLETEALAYKLINTLF